MLMAFAFSQKSLNKLVGVHPDLCRVMKLAITRTPVDFGILEGLRTTNREKTLVAKGASTTMHSRHLPNRDGLGCAVDVGAYVQGELLWEPVGLYEQIAHTVKEVAAELGVPIGWGGDWQTFKDFGHFQLPWGQYP